MKTETFEIKEISVKNRLNDSYEIIENELIENDKFYRKVLGGVLIKSTKFVNVTFRQTTFYASRLEECHFENCTFINCHFEFSTISKCNFVGCDISRTDFAYTIKKENTFSSGNPAIEFLAA